MRDKERNLKAFLDFTSSKRKVVKNYKFTRDECYTEQNLCRQQHLALSVSTRFGSALCSKCDTLITEDMQSGLIVDEKLVIKNILENK